MKLPYDSAISQLDIYLRKLKAYIHTKTYTQIFTASFVKSKTGNNTSVH